ncbi:MAG: hypothetical protein EXS03_05465 [Phycisphaerales bacterium]|nr:hypothetical protein [Phycisphaerales bacterium]
MASLAMQLAFVPPTVARRQIEAIRGLLQSIKPAALVPWSRVVREITQFPVARRAASAEPELVGGPLCDDLRLLALRLSRRAPETIATAVTIPQLAAQWKVTARTIERWRSLGLLCCYTNAATRTHARGRIRIGVRVADAKAFRAAHPELTVAVRRTRLSPEGTAAILSLGREAALRGARRISVVAAEIATATARSRETVRRILAANPQASGGRLVGRDPLATRAERCALASHLRAEGVARLAARLRITSSRADRLRGRVVQRVIVAHAVSALPTDSTIPATFARGDARQVLLAPVWVRVGLDAASRPRSGDEWLRITRTSAGRPQECSNAQLMACRFLLYSVRVWASKPGSERERVEAIDRAETDLRWAAALLHSLLGSAMPAVSRRMRLWLKRDEISVPPQVAQAIVLASAAALFELVSHAPPEQIAQRRVRVDRAVALAVDRALSSMEPPLRDGPQGGRGPSRFDPFHAVAPWIAFVNALSRRVAGAPAARSESALWDLRLGLSGTAPLTLTEIAITQRVPSRIVARRLARSLRVP